MRPVKQPPLGTKINPSSPLARGLAGYWVLNEAGGQLAYNQIGGATKHGTLANGAVFKTDREGVAVSFDGVDDMINVVSTLTPTPPLTFAAEVRPTSTGANVGGILSLGTATADEQSLLFVAGVFWALSQVAGANSQATGTTTIVSGNVYRVVGTWASATLRSIYVNGRLEGTNTTSRAPATGTPSVRIGDRFHVTNQRYPGSINNAAIWTRVLTDSEIASWAANPYQLFEQARRPFYRSSFTAIKTVAGLTRASVKTVDGLAVASVKTWGGVA